MQLSGRALVELSVGEWSESGAGALLKLDGWELVGRGGCVNAAGSCLFFGEVVLWRLPAVGVGGLFGFLVKSVWIQQLG